MKVGDVYYCICLESFMLLRCMILILIGILYGWKMILIHLYIFTVW